MCASNNRRSCSRRRCAVALCTQWCKPISPCPTWGAAFFVPIRVISMAAHAYWKCVSPSKLERLESSLSSWWDCSALTNFFRLLTCLVSRDLIVLADLLLETDLSSSKSFLVLPFFCGQHLAGCPFLPYVCCYYTAVYPKWKAPVRGWVQTITS